MKKKKVTNNYPQLGNPLDMEDHPLNSGHPLNTQLFGTSLSPIADTISRESPYA